MNAGRLIWWKHSFFVADDGWADIKLHPPPGMSIYFVRRSAVGWDREPSNFNYIPFNVLWPVFLRLLSRPLCLCLSVIPKGRIPLLLLLCYGNEAAGFDDTHLRGQQSNYILTFLLFFALLASLSRSASHEMVFLLKSSVRPAWGSCEPLMECLFIMPIIASPSGD